MAALPCAWPAGLANKCLSVAASAPQRPNIQKACRAGAFKVMAASEIPMRRVGNLDVPAILIGMWQVSGGHGQIDRNRAVAEMFNYVDAGFTCFDMADHYGPAEDLYGEFRRQFAAKYGEGALANVHGLTKWVPPPGDMSLPVVEKNIDISRRRMGVQSLDMLQFHWWDYNDRRYLDAMKSLAQLQSAGKVQLVALTNFDTTHVKRIGEAGIKLASNQVSYSIVDTRPEKRMVEYCLQNDIKLLCYGTLLGGLLSDKWLGQPEPLTRRELSTSSLGKYKRFVDQWGSWGLFQELLQLVHCCCAHGENNRRELLAAATAL
eukprot:jgi/Mesvir1/17103/Mv07538-RA.1